MAYGTKNGSVIILQNLSKLYEAIDGSVNDVRNHKPIYGTRRRFRGKTVKPHKISWTSKEFRMKIRNDFILLNLKIVQYEDTKL
jgi:hypothetical protein